MPRTDILIYSPHVAINLWTLSLLAGKTRKMKMRQKESSPGPRLANMHKLVKGPRLGGTSEELATRDPRPRLGIPT